MPSSQLLDIEAGGGERRLGLRQRYSVRIGIDPEEHVALLHECVLRDVDLDDAPRSLGRNRHPGLAHIGVVGLLVAAAGEPEVCAARREQQRDRCHQEKPRQAAYEGKGEVPGGSATIRARFQLEELPDGQTNVKWSGQSSVLGRVISLAGGLLEPVGKKNVQKLIDGLQQALR